MRTVKMSYAIICKVPTGHQGRDSPTLTGALTLDLIIIILLLLLLDLIIIIIIIILILPSVVKIPRVKSSKKLKSKAGVSMHLNRPGTPGQQKSHEIEQS